MQAGSSLTTSNEQTGKSKDTQHKNKTLPCMLAEAEINMTNPVQKADQKKIVVNRDILQQIAKANIS